MARFCRVFVSWALVVGVVASARSPASADPNPTPTPTAEPQTATTFLDAARHSLVGEVYDRSQWHPVGLRNFFHGWDEPWVAGPPGTGQAPRLGWLNSYDGVFYRLAFLSFNWAHDGSDDTYIGGLTVYAPINRRFQFRFDVPYAVSVPASDGGQVTDFGDFQVTPRFLLATTPTSSQALDVTVRTPTGTARTGQDVGAVSPIYNFWWNPTGGFVLRGGIGAFLPYANADRERFTANLAGGYYLTPHDRVPFGDLVGYVAVNLNQLTDSEVSGTVLPNTTTITFTPGFRTHIGGNYYLRGGVEVPATQPQPFDYQVLASVMKSW